MKQPTSVVMSKGMGLVFDGGYVRRRTDGPAIALYNRG